MEEKDIKSFKYVLHECKENIDNYDIINKKFEYLKDKYIADYDPPIKDQELKAEFDNQKANMLKNAQELKNQLKLMKKKHVNVIEDSRFKNSKLISTIEKLTNNIEIKKKKKSNEEADSRHTSSIAAITAQRNLKFLEDIEYNTHEEKIDILQKELEKRRVILMNKIENDDMLNSYNKIDSGK